MILQGARCALRPWRAGDADALARHANNPNVAMQLRDRFPHPYSRNDAVRFLKFSTSLGTPTNLAIEVGGEAVGGVGYVPGTDVERFSAEVGYWLSERHWGRGIVTEAVVLLTEYLFGDRNLLRLFALPFADNVASTRVLEKAGYVREAVLRSSAVKNGIARDQALYAKVNTAWRGVQPVVREQTR
jgi:RimJ/RimL family protein N-acetyltransferase